MAAQPKAVPDQKPSPISVFKIEGVEYRWDWRKLMNSEVRFLQRSVGLTFKQWSDGLQEMNGDCIAALYVLLMKRKDPESVDLKTADLDDYDFDIGSFEYADESEDPTTAEAPDSSATDQPAVA